MFKPLVLFVDDDSDIVLALQAYFGRKDFEIDFAENGVEALRKARLLMPHLIMLDVMLPDIDGYEVYRSLQFHPRTSHIPVIFLSQKDERSDILQGLELGAYDYVTKPFDVIDLRLRMHNTILHTEGKLDTHSRLPTEMLIDKQLNRFTQEKSRVLLDVRVNSFQPFTSLYGSEAGYHVLSHISRLLTEIVEDASTAPDFIGHVKDDHFIILTTPDRSTAISQILKKRFEAERQRHYPPDDIGHGLISHVNQKEVPLMSVAVRKISSEECQSLGPTAILERAANSSLQEA